MSSTTPASDLHSALTIDIWEQLCSSYQVHELPSDTTDNLSDCMSTSLHSLPKGLLGPSQCTEVIVNTALLACIEALEAEKCHLKEKLGSMETQQRHLRINQIQHDDKLFTGFLSYLVLHAFFWISGTKLLMSSTTGDQRLGLVGDIIYSCKLDPPNQFFLTLVKLRLYL